MHFTIKKKDPCLVLAMEEAGEFIQACSKIIRHGVTEKHKAQLIEETGDMMAVIYLLESHGIVSEEEVIARAKRKIAKLESYEEKS